MKSKKITSIENKRIKDLIKLSKKSKFRNKTNLFIVEGLKEINASIENNYEIKSLFYDPKIIELNKIHVPINSEVIEVSSNIYEKISFRSSTEGIIAVAIRKNYNKEKIKIDNKKVVLILDGIEKPGNIGAILRTSIASNVDTIIITNKKCDTHNPNVIRSSVGSFFKTKIIYLENNEALEFLKKNKFKIYAASLKSDKIYSNENYNFPIGLVFGSENEGISKFWEENSDVKIKIPMGNKIDSLNVSVSCAIILYEINRQSKFKL